MGFLFCFLFYVGVFRRQGGFFVLFYVGMFRRQGGFFVLFCLFFAEKPYAKKSIKQTL